MVVMMVVIVMVVMMLLFACGMLRIPGGRHFKETAILRIMECQDIECRNPCGGNAYPQRPEAADCGAVIPFEREPHGEENLDPVEDDVVDEFSFRSNPFENIVERN